MKYGKEFQQILDDPSLPPDWRTSAIEYRRLKKLIKDVVSELSGMGLSPDVLHKLLVTDGQVVTEKSHDDESSGNEKDNDDDADILEFEFESPESSPPSVSAQFPSQAKEHEPLEVVVDPIRNDNDLAGPSSLPNHHHKTFRLRLLSETQAEKPILKPMGVMDMIKSRTEPKRRASEPLVKHGSPENKKRSRRVRRAVADHGGVKAEYVLVGNSANPTPQLRLHVSKTSSPDRRSPSRSHTSSGGFTSDSGSHTGTTDSEAEPLTSESEDEDAPRAALSTRGPASPLRTPRAFGFRSPLTLPAIDVIPPSPTLHRLKQAMSPIWALASGNSIQDGLRDLTLDSPTTPTRETFDTPQANSNAKLPPAEYFGSDRQSAKITEMETTTQLQPPTESPERERDFIIPLASDVAFFNLLTTALTSLSTFHAAQQELFRQSVELLCGMIRASIQPGASPTILATPFTPTPDTAISSGSQSTGKKSQTKSSKKDLYVWREIFTLWIEHEIFESTAERTRGERTVEQAQERLQKFANEVVKRGLGDRRTIKGKKSRGAWDEFLRLNVLLLDLKRFQMANINAARKILKKHDKRTALTASAGFPEFVRSTLSNSVDQDGNINTWNFYNTSLPHVLLASLTDTLLPILPSLDDYACLICTSIAFKPIRLTCGHLFCVRCLVKMQRAGKGECPLCRSQVVLLANKECLDVTLMRFMKDWFPKEVKEKQRDNDREIAQEHSGGGIVAHSSQGGPERCVIM